MQIVYFAMSGHKLFDGSMYAYDNEAVANAAHPVLILDKKILEVAHIDSITKEKETT